MAGFWVVRRVSDRKYLRPSGSENTWTRDLARAARFKTRAEAERERCPENEYTEEVAA